VRQDPFPGAGHGLNRNIAPAARERFLDECGAWGIPGEAVEAEAMPPDDLRDLLSSHILTYIDARQWELEMAVEENERRDLASMLDPTA
jgi:hypothetical protein